MSAQEDRNAEFGSSSPSYWDLIASKPATLVMEESGDDYQGDTYAVLLGDDGRYGYLNFGWGSCSGCDALQDILGYRYDLDDDTLIRLRALRDEMWDDVQWFDTLEALKAWVANDEVQQGRYTWHTRGTWTLGRRSPSASPR